MMSEFKHTIAFDFDNVIHKYRQGWKDGTIYDELNNTIIAIIWNLLHDGYPVVIISTREPQQIADYLNQHDMVPFRTEIVPDDVKFWNYKEGTIGVTNRKIPFGVIVDDRAIHFNPANPVINAKQLMNFKPNKYE